MEENLQHTATGEVSAVSVDTGDGANKPPRPFVNMLRARQQAVQIALAFDKTYEWAVTENGAKIALSSAKPLLNYSWTSLKFPQSELLKDYDLGEGLKIGLPIGVTVVMGMAGSGKTRFTRDLLYLRDPASGRVTYISMFEPGRASDVLALGPHAYCPMVEIEMADIVVPFLVQPGGEVLVIDSLRYLFYTATIGGATGKGGVNMALFMRLTHLDRVASAMGKRLVVVINPMTDDEDAFAFYQEAALSAVSGLIVMKDYKSGLISTRYGATRDLVKIRFPGSTPRPVADSGDHSPTIKRGTAAQPHVSDILFDRKSYK